MKALTDQEVREALSHQPFWKLADGKIVREWTFADFIAAMKFVDQVAAVAEAAGHHPDIDIRYNKVTLGLVTHDAGGVTKADIKMAAALSERFPT